MTLPVVPIPQAQQDSGPQKDISGAKFGEGRPDKTSAFVPGEGVAPSRSQDDGDFDLSEFLSEKVRFGPAHDDDVGAGVSLQLDHLGNDVFVVGVNDDGEVALRGPFIQWVERFLRCQQLTEEVDLLRYRGNQGLCVGMSMACIDPYLWGSDTYAFPHGRS